MENLNHRVEHSKIINLDMDFLNDTELSILFHAADAVLLPYKVSSGSGVMFDALAHGLPLSRLFWNSSENLRQWV